MNIRRHLKWIVIAAVVLLLGVGVMRAMQARKAQQEAVTQAATAKLQTVVELAPTDVVKAEVTEIAQGLPV